MADDKPAVGEPFKLQFHYIKGPDYREAACHGAIGGPTPQGKLWLGFFAERHPIPRIVEFEVSPPSGSLWQFDERAQPPTNVESRQGVIRHVEFGVYLDVDVAERLHQWLGENVARIREATAPPSTAAEPTSKSRGKKRK